MHLSPGEQAKVLLHQVRFMAQQRLARGLQLNQAEATALIASQLQERIRDGTLPGVSALLKEIQVEGTFHDGVFLVTVHEPIATMNGNLEAALHGSFLPLPPNDAFPAIDPSQYSRESAPGAVVVKQDRIAINRGRKRIRLRVTNQRDRPIQIGSHYHFIETNSWLEFDRGKAYGMRLDIVVGTAVRFEESRTVTLCGIAGAKIISGGNRLASGVVDPLQTDEIVRNLVQMGFKHKAEPGALEVDEDTDTVYGDEVKFGGGKTIREGMGQATNRTAEEVVDLVITNALIIDWSGIYKADIGVKDGIIKAIEKAGNPDTMDKVHPDLIIGSATEVVAGEKLIVTAGAIDVHCHYISPDQVPEALAAGTTTMIGGGTGPSTGTNATTCTPSPFYMQHMLAATDGLPMNFGFTGKGNDSGQKALEDIVKAGAAGLKVHEDWGATFSVILSALDVGDKYDVQVNIHTDTLNESGFVDRTIDAFGGRTIHTYHTEGAGGGHAPDIIVVCGLKNVLPSSTNPTMPFAQNTIEEHIDMLMVAHHLDRNIPEDVAFADSRIRKETIAAEDVLHDMGAISMISSDSQAMGRVAEVVSRTWRTASKMRERCGPLTALGDHDGHDNGRARIIRAERNASAITRGISHLVGDVAAGKLADLVLWKPENFGSKPEMIIKSGVIVWAQMGEANGSIPTVQPIIGRAIWGSFAASAALNSVSFVSQVSLQSGGAIASYGLKKRCEAVRDCRNVQKTHMKWNSATPDMSVDPEKYEVYADGVLVDVEPADCLPLTRYYNLF